MTIDRIDIKSFGQLCNVTLEFSDSVNVIEGQNEAGKSTIAAFIKYMLYGFDPEERPGEVSERRRRINWDSGIAEGSMHITARGKKYLITRSTVQTENAGRPTYEETSSIIDLESGTPAFGKLPAGEVFFGVERSLFENTAFIGQLDSTAINEGSVQESIENILFSGNERTNTQRAINRITTKMQTLLHQGNTGGVIYDLMQKQEELEDKLRRTDEDNKQILAKEAELHEIRAKREDAEDKRSRLYDLDRDYCNFMLIQSFDKLHELEEENAKRQDAYNSYIEENTKNGYTPTSEYLTELALARKGVNDTFRRKKDAEALYAKERSAVGITREIEGAIEFSDELGGEDKIREEINSHFIGKIKTLGGGIVALLLAIASLVFALVGPPIMWLKITVGALGAIALAAAGFLGYLYLGICKKSGALAAKFGTETTEQLKAKISVIAEARNKRDTIINKTESAKDALDTAAAEYESAKAHLGTVVRRWRDIPPISDINGYLDSLEADVRAFLDEKNRLMLEKSNVEITVKEIRRTLADKSEIDIRAQVPPIKRKVLVEIRHEDIINGIADARAIIEEQQRLSFSVESELAALKLRAIDPGEIYSKIQALDTKINDLRAKHKAYFVALRAIESAQGNLRREISPRLGSYAAGILDTMTDGKYSKLGVDPELKLNFTTLDGKSKAVDYLSGGTRDLTYIAMRMALIDMLYAEKPPVCLDETFANQDNNRASAMMKALSSLSDEGYQSFVFTCRAREATLAASEIKNPGIYKLSVE